MLRLFKLCIISLCLLACFASGAKEKPFIQTKKKKIIVDSIVSDANGTLTYKRASLTQKIKPKKYIYARIPMPKEIVRASRKLKAKKYANAVSEFNKAYKKYQFLGWDVFCLYYEAYALKKLGKIKKAITKLKILNVAPIDKKKNANYCRAKKLLATIYLDASKIDEAEKVLTSIRDTDDPAIFLFVNNSRGDIFTKKGKNKDAVLMYLRTIMLSTKDNNKKERPEALVKIIKILKTEKNNRFRDFEKILKSDYPGFSL